MNVTFQEHFDFSDGWESSWEEELRPDYGYIVSYSSQSDTTTLTPWWCGDQDSSDPIATLKGEWTPEDILRVYGMTPIRPTNH